MTKNPETFTFKEHVFHLSVILRARYNLILVQLDDTSFNLENGEIAIAITSGGQYPNNSWVSTSIRYLNPEIHENCEERKDFYISEYGRYRKIDLWRLYPSHMSVEVTSTIKQVMDASLSDSPYMFAGSPFSLVSDIVFLNLFGDPVLSLADKQRLKEELRKFGDWRMNDAESRSR